jgi:endoglucanase
MRLKNIFSITLFLLLGFIIQGCSDSDKADATRLTVVRNNAEINQLTFSVGSGSAIIGIQSDGDWTAESSDTTWCKLAVHAGYGYADSLRNSYTKVSVTKNEGEARQTTITVKAGGLTKLITVSQKGTGTDPGDTFMSAFTFVDNMVIGYNLGNTLDSNPYGDWWNPEGKTPVEWETQWGQPETTRKSSMPLPPRDSTSFVFL